MARPCRISAYWCVSILSQNPGDDCGWSEPTTPVFTTGNYQYDGSGNIKQIGATAYTYDAVSRLRQVTPSGANTESYTYDTFGNRTTPPATTQPCVFGPNGTFVCTYPSFLSLDADPATNRVRTWTYDPAGNATGDGLGAPFSWDGIGTMRTSTRAARELHFLYNADDERIALVERTPAGNKSTFTLRGLGNELLRTFVDDETSGTQSWTWKEDEIWRGSTLLANVTSTGAKHLVLDHLGSPRAISTTSTSPVSVQNFSPFGMGGLTGTGSLMFTAHERDSATLDDSVTGLPDYMHARHYVAGPGRFLSVDPDEWWILQNGNDEEKRQFEINLRRPQVSNRYAYTYNNPIRHTDPDGKAALVDDAFELYLLGSVIVLGTEVYLQSPNANDPRRTNAQVIGMKITALAAGIGTLISLAQNNRHNQAVVASQLAAAAKELGKVSGAGGPGKDPDFDHHKAEIKAMLDRALRVAKRLPKKAYEEILRQVRIMGSEVGLKY